MRVDGEPTAGGTAGGGRNVEGEFGGGGRGGGGLEVGAVVVEGVLGDALRRGRAGPCFRFRIRRWRTRRRAGV